ncbi:TRAP transporter substrate-binding protein DctP [Chloroflexota bacterium]
MKKKLIVLGLIVALVAIPLAACAQEAPAPVPAPAPAPAPAEIIVWKAVQSQPLGMSDFKNWEEKFVAVVNEKAGGAFKIDLLGGPEAIPIENQAAALRDGVVQITAQYGNRIGAVAEPFTVWQNLDISLNELKANGGFDWLKKEAEKSGLYWVGPMSEGTRANTFVFTSKAVTRPQELAGQSMATYGSIKPWVEALGMTYTNVVPTERYAAVERGVTDGAVVSLGSGAKFSIPEVAKYLLWPGAFSYHDLAFANLDAWNKLPDKYKQIINETADEVMAGAKMWREEIANIAIDTLKQQGVEIITFSDADTDWYIGQAYNAAWADTIQKYPAWGETLKGYIEKK